MTLKKYRGHIIDIGRDINRKGRFKAELTKSPRAGSIGSGKTVKEAYKWARKNIDSVFFSKSWP